MFLPFEIKLLNDVATSNPKENENHHFEKRQNSKTLGEPTCSKSKGEQEIGERERERQRAIILPTPFLVVKPSSHRFFLWFTQRFVFRNLISISLLVYHKNSPLHSSSPKHSIHKTSFEKKTQQTCQKKTTETVLVQFATSQTKEKIWSPCNWPLSCGDSMVFTAFTAH